MAKTANLFPGVSPLSLGGLPNEDELAQACPAEFKRKNPWSDYAERTWSDGVSLKNWEWKSQDPATQRLQMNCFSNIIGGFMSHEKKMAVAGWMLSEMLVRVPEFIPRAKPAQSAP